MNKIYALLIGTGILMAASCTQENQIQPDEVSYLRLNTEICTRAIVESSSFNTGDQIGVFVRNADGTDYVSGSYNILATYDGNWIFENEVPLSDAPATVYAYYPYNTGENLEDNLLWFDLNKEGGADDYLVATTTETFDASSPVANLQFKHVLARVTFSITCGAGNKYTLSSVVLRSPSHNLFHRGYIDLRTGRASQSLYNGDLGDIKVNTDAVVYETEPVIVEMLVYPLATEAAGDLTLELTMDGVPYIVSMPAVNWEAGRQYTYPVNFK